MEGSLLVPPDRGTIIGRAVWKPRYVVLGSPPQMHLPHRPSIPRSNSTARIQAAVAGLRHPSKADDTSRAVSDELWLSIYRQKGDLEPVSQHPISSIKSCEVQEIQYRKPGPVLPTLVIQLESDSGADKLRRRRSSRTSGLSISSSYPNSLLFRTLADDRFSIYDWQITIQPLIEGNTDDDTPVAQMSPMSPKSPAFTAFVNPFASRVPAPERQHSANSNSRPELAHRGSSNSSAYKQNSPARDRIPTSTLISPTPSLRSKRSDISSQASSMSRPQGFNSALQIQQLPNDLPSPASTIGYDDQFISGWTAAQGRSSALSSHTRGSNNTSLSGTSPPAPRESILDRAFMLRYIPGSERHPSADEEKLSSIARFEALMKEAEERRNTKIAPKDARKTSTNGWELEEDEEDSDDEGPQRTKARKYGEGNILEEEDLDLDIYEMPSSAQRALEFISGRRTPPASSHRPMSPKSPPLPFLADRPLLNTRKSDRPSTLTVPSAPNRPTSASDADPNRRSSNSVKRLSFTEFTRRLSSTSSLLLVQTNASSGSSRASKRSSVEDDGEEFGGNAMGMQKGLSQSRLSGMARGRGVGGGNGNVNVTGRDESADRKCGTWRGSGFGAAFGGEGGFL